LALDLGSSLKPAFTCTDNEQVYHLIKDLIFRNRRTVEMLM
jgi:hypothetical protein